MFPVAQQTTPHCKRESSPRLSEQADEPAAVAVPGPEVDLVPRQQGQTGPLPDPGPEHVPESIDRIDSLHFNHSNTGLRPRLARTGTTGPCMLEAGRSG